MKASELTSKLSQYDGNLEITAKYFGDGLRELTEIGLTQDEEGNPTQIVIFVGEKITQ